MLQSCERKLDFRLGGIPLAYFGDARDKDMRVPDEVRQCVVFLLYKNKKKMVKLAGTGVIVTEIDQDRDMGFISCVTAKHVVIGAKKHSIDGTLYMRGNIKGDHATAKLVPTPIDNWLFHPDDPSVDAAIFLGVPEPSIFDVRGIGRDIAVTNEIIEEHHIGVGDEVFLTGLFVNHFGKSRSLPIVRTGNLAMMPEEPVKIRLGDANIDAEAYLIEVRSMGGLSGSPVFVHIPGPEYPSTIFFWLGNIHGHWDLVDPDNDSIMTENPEGLVERINTGMAVVVPSYRILEIFDQESVIEMKDKASKEVEDRRLPTPDSPVIESFSKFDFLEGLKKASRPKPSELGEGSSKTSE